MKKILIGSLFSSVLISTGFFLGWWANSPGHDFLCSKPSVYILSQDVRAEGISIVAGTEIDLRLCEYANRFTVSLYTEKGSKEALFEFKNSAPNIGNHGASQYPIEEN
ncbi:hypothetical protein ACJJIU_01480 [Microbulbifer sp. CnH-101-E]|uniref:hypothetical protein n=1 Tax=unclassified Microbulbifer TaxID=2619833 RepID=UPI0040390B3C